SLLRLAEGLALVANMPNQSVEITDTPPEASSPGKLLVVFGLSSELEDILATVPPEAMSGPMTAFVADARPGNSTPVGAAPTPKLLRLAVDSITGTVDRPLTTPRMTLNSVSYWVPDIPLFVGSKRLPLSELGIPTQEFSGRRFRAEF